VLLAPVLGVSVLIAGAKEQSNVSAVFSLEIKTLVGGKESGISKAILYASPNRWRVVKKITDELTEYALCDSQTAWTYTMMTNSVRHIKRWKVSDVTRIHGEEQTYEYLRGEAFSGVLTPANPFIKRWKEFDTKEIRRLLRLTGEENIGDVATMKLETVEKPIFRLWFAKQDGLLRRQIVYNAATGEEWMQSIVTKVDMKPKVDERAFAFEPPEGATVSDETNSLIQVLKELKKKDQPEPE
jgi:outer membrane lipoprotein-sorting protein